MTRIESAPRLSPDDEAIMTEGFASYNDPFAGTGNRETIALTARNGAGGLIGALEAVLFYEWMSVNRLWVQDAARGLGIGTQLMQQAESIAKERGCVGSYLNTFDFQARGFYEKLGFQVFGTLNDCPAGHQRFFMQKRLASSN